MTLKLRQTLYATIGFAVLSATSCGGPSADECIVDQFDAQAQSRFVAGETYYLPVIADTASCADVSWTVAERPADSTDPIVRGNDGIWRITPVTAGDYRFELSNTTDGQSVDLGVVPAESRPFFNLNYYAAHAASPVGEELWIANVQRSTVSRVDPDSLALLGEIQVGPWPVSLAWREGMDVAVVAQRGNDTLGILDVETGRLIDAVWVGDEPAEVALSPDGSTAYVSLKAENAVAVVDLARRVRTARIDVVTDPLAIAVSPDGATVWVASHRSGHPDRFPYDDDPVENERDIAVIDTATNEVVDWWLDFGTTITEILPSEDGERLYFSRLRNDTEANLGSVDEPSFMHEIAIVDAGSGDELASADLLRQDSSGGHAVSLHGMTMVGDRLWVVAEASNLAVALDPETLAELGRTEVAGRPRSVAMVETGAGPTLFAHGSQAATLTRVSDFETTDALILTEDPRPAEVIDGQAYFTGAGEQYAENWACNSCHADGLSDTLVWNAGPFSGRKVSRPFFWLEGTYPLGWDGYLSSVDNYAFTVNTNVGVRPTTAEHRALSGYLASIMPPPAENGYTRRDGTLSPLGLEGKQVFENEANCASCHPLPLTTSRAVLGQGVTEGTTDVPGLIGSYRLAVWLKRGEATDLHGAIDQVFESLGDPGLSEDQRAALDRFMLEMTARDFFVLSSDPRPNAKTLAVDQSIELVFSHPVFDDPANLAKVTLLGPDGAEVQLERSLDADGRHLTLTPSAALAHASDYTVVVDPSFESFGEQTLWTPEGADAEERSAWEIALTTVEPAQLSLSGDYLWIVDMPTADIAEQQFDLENTLETLVPFTVTAGTTDGGELLLDYGDDLILERLAVVSGDQLLTPALPIPIGPSFADGSGMQATLVDLDEDGVGDYAEGTLTISGPGFVESGITWRMTRPTAEGECPEGPQGDLPVSVEFVDGNPVVDWEGSDTADGLGVYFIGPDATPPAGPGQPVTGGEVFWAVQLEAFPQGFAGPVTYATVPPGAVDETANIGGGDGPVALESGDCVKATVTTTAFGQGAVVFAVP